MHISHTLGWLGGKGWCRITKLKKNMIKFIKICTCERKKITNCLYGKRSQWSVEEGGIRHRAEWKRKHMKRTQKNVFKLIHMLNFIQKKTRTNWAVYSAEPNMLRNKGIIYWRDCARSLGIWMVCWSLRFSKNQDMIHEFFVFSKQRSFYLVRSAFH